MRQAIRALAWATYIFWMILIFFTATAVYSAFQLKPGFGPLDVSTLDGTLTVSLPFSLANDGFYDISNINLTTLVRDNRGSSMSDSSTFVPLVPRGSNVSVTHNMSMSIDQMTTENLSYLLFNDSVFDVAMALRLDYAYAVPFQISTNFTIPWGAPLSNLTLGTYSNISNGVVVPVSFENHSFFELNGTMRLEIVDSMNQVVGEGTSNINVPPQTGYRTSITVVMSSVPANIREARLYIETSVLNYGPVVMPLV